MSLAVHLVVEPVSEVLFTVDPDVGTLALNFIHLELSLIDRAISEGQFSLRILLAFGVLAFVDGSVGPGLPSMTMLLIITPISHILRSICMRVRA